MPRAPAHNPHVDPFDWRKRAASRPSGNPLASAVLPPGWDPNLADLVLPTLKRTFPGG